MKKIFLYLIFCLLGAQCRAEIDFESLLCDLEMVRWVDCVLERPLPLSYNYLFSTGYFVTPSARMASPGDIGVGGAKVPPYTYINSRVQPFRNVELSANWRIFKGVQDGGLSPHGFGDYADRGANFKVALFTPEQSRYALPGFAFGIEDFMGSKLFTNYFVVATHVWSLIGLETSLGWGAGRYSHGPSRGFFGAASWHPYFHLNNIFLEGICLSAEYDPIDYSNSEREPHPDGRISNFPVNCGLQYTYKNFLSFSASLLRGRELALSAGASYDWGSTRGLLPKIKDPVPCRTLFSEETTLCQMAAAFKKQGFFLRSAWLNPDQNRLYLTVVNLCWWRESQMRHQLQHLLAAWPHRDVNCFTVTIEANQLLCQSYCYRREFLERYVEGSMGRYEFDLLTPRKNPIEPSRQCECLVYKRANLRPCWRINPRFETFLGSSRGKFKYDFGPSLNILGNLPFCLYYDASFSYTLLSSLHGLSDFDFYNPSQLPNVATDYVRYRQQGAFSTDRLYLQGVKNFRCPLFSRLALGYFQVNYAGLAGELLWYPAKSLFAIGIEGALLKKRSYSGLGFQSTLRQLEGFKPTYQPYTILDQYFLDLYFDMPSFCLFTKISFGQFLARDLGARVELTRYFPSGLRLSGWMTLTNANDFVNSVRYFDRGITVEIPFEIFYKCSSRRMLTYGLGAWLRDAGYRSWVGRSLFEIVNRERRF